MELTATKYEETEVGLIPEGWEIKELGQLAKVIGGGTPKTTVAGYWNGKISWFTPTEVGKQKYLITSNRKITPEGLQSSSAQILPIGTILLTSRAGIGDLGILTKEAATNQGFQSLLVYNEYDNEYVYYLLSTLKPKLLSRASGSTFLEISPSKVKEIRVGVPPTLIEQQAISKVLSDTDALIHALEKKIAKKKLIKKGVMQKLMTPKEAWQVKTIKDIANYRRGSFPQPYGLPQWYDDISGMPFIQVVDVEKNFKLKRETKQKISKAGAEMSVFVKKGTVILTIQGSIGRICITDYDAYVDRTLLIFESLKEDFDMYFFMLSIWLKFQTEKQNAPGGIIKTITKEALSSFEIAYPKKEEQSQIAQILSDMEKEIETLEKKLAKYQLAKQGMMQQLLTGKIRLV